MSKRLDITGQKFNRWTVDSYNFEKSKEKGMSYWNCTCICGTKKCILGDNLKSEKSKSCGCLKKEKMLRRNYLNENKKIIIICKQCGNKKKVIPSLKNISKFCNQKCKSKWGSENNTGKNNPNWKKKVKIICEQCGKEKKVKPSLKKIRKFCSKKCYYQWMSENASGKNSSAWKGGISSLYCRIRTSKKHKEFVQRILRRDNYTCQLSGEIGGNLNVHHKKSFAEISKENNITTLEESLDCEELWSENNVVVLSEKWHTGIKINNPYAFHKLYGTFNFTEQDFYKWFEEFKIDFQKEIIS